MAGSPIRAAIVGCGVIAPNHAHALALDRRAKLVAACDLDVNKAKATVKADRYAADFRDIVNDSGIDLVIICTPHATHADICCAALDAGKHVICEKPLATTPQDIERMVAAARKSKKVSSGIFQHRFTPLARRLHELMRGGDFGAFEAAELKFHCTRDAKYYASGPWRGKWNGEGGGLMINQAIHSLDLMNWFAGVPVSLKGVAERRLLGDTIEVEDYAEATIAYASGGTGKVIASNDQATTWGIRLVAKYRNGGFTLGEDHRLEAIDHPNQALAAELRALNEINTDAFKMPGKECYGDHHAIQIADCLDAIVAGRPATVTLADAAISAHTVLGIYQSTSLGGAEVALPVTGYRQPKIVSGAARAQKT